MDVIEAMETCSAARYLKPDPVPQDLIERVIYAATRASSQVHELGLQPDVGDVCDPQLVDAGQFHFPCQVGIHPEAMIGIGRTNKLPPSDAEEVVLA